MSRHRLRVWIVAALVIAFTAVSAIVFAEWLATGTGEGNAAAGTAVELRVEPVASIGVDATRLVPGGTGDVEVVLFNDNPYEVEVREIVQDDPITSDQTGCDGTTGEVTYTTQTGSWVAPANGDLFVRLVDALAMGVDAADACQGAEFTVPLAVTGGSSVVGASTSTTSGGVEVCDGIDNDDNGFVDEDLWYCIDGSPAPNTDGDSLCLEGWFDSDSMRANGCEFTVSPEVCDYIDNDGNGVVDDPWPEVGDVCTIEGVGVGTYQCSAQDSLVVECVLTG